jgi:hypothetical protein
MLGAGNSNIRRDPTLKEITVYTHEMDIRQIKCYTFKKCNITCRNKKGIIRSRKNFSKG